MFYFYAYFFSMFLGYMYDLVDLSFVLAVSDVSIRVVFVCWECYKMSYRFA